MTIRKKPLRQHGRRRFPNRKILNFLAQMEDRKPPFYCHPTKGWRTHASLRWSS